MIRFDPHDVYSAFKSTLRWVRKKHTEQYKVIARFVSVRTQRENIFWISNAKNTTRKLKLSLDLHTRYSASKSIWKRIMFFLSKISVSGFSFIVFGFRFSKMRCTWVYWFGLQATYRGQHTCHLCIQFNEECGDERPAQRHCLSPLCSHQRTNEQRFRPELLRQKNEQCFTTKFALWKYVPWEHKWRDERHVLQNFLHKNETENHNNFISNYCIYKQTMNDAFPKLFTEVELENQKRMLYPLQYTIERWISRFPGFTNARTI